MAQLSELNLHPWQHQAIDEGAKRRFGICARVGAGKTVVTASIAAKWISKNPGNRVLLVAPRPVLDSTWANEFSKWSHLDHLTIDMAHSLSPKERRVLWAKGTHNFTTCTPDLLHDFLKTVAANPNHGIRGIVVDESHQFKNADSRRSQALQALTSGTSSSVLLVSGTPCPNGYQDLWVPGHILSKAGPFWCGNPYAFLAQRFDQVTDYSYRPKAGEAEKITAEFGKLAVSVGKDHDDGVPPPIYVEHPFTHRPEHLALMTTFSSERKAVVDGHKLDGDTDGAFLAKYHQMTQGFVYINDNPKVLSNSRIEALATVIQDIKTPVFVGAKFKADVEMIRARFPHATVYAGETTSDERVRIVNEWNAGRIKLLVASPQAAGTGLNLQFGPCEDLIWYAHPWDSALRTQFEGRLVRQGQTRQIRIHQLISSVGLDDALLTTLARKESGAQALMSAIRIGH